MGKSQAAKAAKCKKRTARRQEQWHDAHDRVGSDQEEEADPESAPSPPPPPEDQLDYGDDPDFVDAPEELDDSQEQGQSAQGQGQSAQGPSGSQGAVPGRPELGDDLSHQMRHQMNLGGVQQHQTTAAADPAAVPMDCAAAPAGQPAQSQPPVVPDTPRSPAQQVWQGPSIDVVKDRACDALVKALQYGNVVNKPAEFVPQTDFGTWARGFDAWRVIVMPEAGLTTVGYIAQTLLPREVQDALKAEASVQNSPQLDWEQVKTYMLSSPFHKQKTDLEKVEEWANLYQTATLQSFITDFRVLMAKLPVQVPDVVKIYHFLRGLRDPNMKVLWRIHPLLRRDWQSWEEFLQFVNSEARQQLAPAVHNAWQEVRGIKRVHDPPSVGSSHAVQRDSRAGPSGYGRDRHTGAPPPRQAATVDSRPGKQPRVDAADPAHRAHVQGLSEDNRLYLRHSGLCYRCKQPGHPATSCDRPIAPMPPSWRAELQAHRAEWEAQDRAKAQAKADKKKGN